MPLMTLRWAALAAVIPVVLLYADTPFRTFGQRFLLHRGAERLVLFSIELNLVLLWALTKLLLLRDADLGPPLIEPGLAMLGVLMAWTGALLMVWARVALGHWFSGTFGLRQGHELVTGGPYALVRHPMYTGFVLLAIALGVAWNSAVTVGFGLLYMVPFWMHTMIEEQMLSAHFGEAWTAYRSRVPRMIPGMNPRI